MCVYILYRCVYTYIVIEVQKQSKRLIVVGLYLCLDDIKTIRSKGGGDTTEREGVLPSYIQ